MSKNDDIENPPNLTPTEWEALATRLADLDAMPTLTPSQHSERTAVREVLKLRPKPVLEDGLYEVTDKDWPYLRVLHVRDGRYAVHLNPDGTLFVGGHTLPADTSGWRRLRVLADDEVAVERHILSAAEGHIPADCSCKAFIRAAQEESR